MQAKEKTELIRSDSWGIYIPQNFAEAFPRQNVEEEDWNILLNGPEGELYWEVWETVIQEWKGPDGEWLWQDGDLFLVAADAVWNDDSEIWE